MALQELHRPEPPAHGPPGKPPGRRMPAARVLIIGSVALLLAALLNSSSLLDLAKSQPAGSRLRSVAVDLANPLHSFAETVGLTKPREALDRLFGRDDKAAASAPTTTASAASPTTVAAAAAPTTTAQSGTSAASAPAASPGSTPAASPASTAAAAPTGTVSLFVAGDSMAQGLAVTLGQDAEDAGGFDTHVHAKASTGLTRPDYYDWPAALAADMSTYSPKIVVLMFGGNDGQPIQAADGQYYQVSDPGWSAEYGARVGAVMDQLGKGGRKVVWVGVPEAKSANFTARLKVINQVLQAQAATRPWVRYVDAWSLFSAPGGGYSATLVDSDGKVKRMRTKDGYHLTIDGYRRLGRAVFTAVEAARAS